MDRQTAGASESMMEMKKKSDWKKEVMQGLRWDGYHLAKKPIP